MLIDQFHSKVLSWCHQAFGEKVATDKTERCARFFEEAVELVQSMGFDEAECHRLIHHIYSLPPGRPFQEVGGVMVTLAALCGTKEHPMSLHIAATKELRRIDNPETIDKIRGHHKSKPGALCEGIPDTVFCEIKWCQSGLAATETTTEIIGDGAFTTSVCKVCKDLFGEELPEADKVRKILKNRG